MTNVQDFKRINKTVKIFTVVQCVLVALLVFMAMNFQAKLQAVGRAPRFMSGVIAAFVVQMLLFYPIFRFASKEADRDVSLVGKTLTQEETKEFIKKKRWADVIKMSTFGFYIIFILAAPADPFVLSVIFYSFILTILTYLQCYNFIVKKLKKEKGEA